MRTTVTLDPDVDARIRKLMRERGLSFKDAVNTAIREGLAATGEGEPFETPAFEMGPARLPVERALALAGELQDEDLLRKRTVGK